MVIHDYAGWDTESQLDRDGIFRVNIAIGRSGFEKLLGHAPGEHAAHHDRFDYTATDAPPTSDLRGPRLGFDSQPGRADQHAVAKSPRRCVQPGRTPVRESNGAAPIEHDQGRRAQIRHPPS